MNINFSIPVTLSDYRQSDNTLYSFAKLKIFYVGETGDKRLFTKEFSDKVVASLPYVPVVGYYSKEKDDFVGHNQQVQHIYGVVPEDSGVEYIKEDGKEYAVCDVILYTGRKDDTGDIAQKIVGKSHSLELNPSNTTYKVNKDSNGKFKNVEFLTGTLLGLSVLGDGEKPAFSGSEFFTENQEVEEIFEGLKEQVKIFVQHIKQRGENMEATNTVTTQVDNTLQTGEVTSEPQATFVVEGTSTASTSPEGVVATVTTPVVTREQKFVESFMRVTYDEVQKRILDAFYKRFGENVYVVQWSPFEKVIVYLNFEDWKYYRIDFTEIEESEQIVFGNSVLVKPRYLTDEEIDKLFPEANEDGQFKGNEGETGKTVEPNEKGTEVNQQGVFLNNENTNKGENIEKNTTTTIQAKTTEELNAIALSNSEREELTSLRAEVTEYRRTKKLALVEGFKNDLDSKFIDNLSKEVDKYTFEELEISLAKEFTRVSKQQTQKAPKFVPFVYNGNNTTGAEDRESLIKRLVDTHK